MERGYERGGVRDGNTHTHTEGCCEREGGRDTHTQIERERERERERDCVQ